MTTPLQANLDATGIRNRFLTGPARVFLCGDSITAAEVLEKRFFPAALRAWNMKLSGVFIPSARLGGGGGDGMAVLHPSITETSATQGQYDPMEAGEFGLVSYPSNVLLAASRYERKWTGDTANDTRIGEHYLDDQIKLDVASSGYQWRCGDWLAGKSVSVGLVYVTHANGLDGVRLKTRILSPTVNGGSTLNTDKTAINTNGSLGIAETVAAFGSEVPSPLIPSDWTNVGFQLTTPTDGTDETGTGLVELFGHIYVDDAVDGIHLGVLANSGDTIEDWLNQTDTSMLAKLIEVTKADTFVAFFGANDSGASLTKSTFKANLQTWIDTIATASATARGNDPTILTPKFVLPGVHHVQGRSLISDYADAMYEIAVSDSYKDKCGFINLYKIAGDFEIINETLLEDGTHPSRIGAITLMQAFWNEMADERPVLGGVEADTLTDIANAALDQADGVDSGVTVRQAHRLMAAAMAGKVSGAGTTSVKIRDLADSKDRITATVDENGNRSAVTLNTT